MTELFEKDGIQYIKNLIRESYYEKRIAFENFLENQKQITLKKFIKDIFNEQCFAGSNIPKADFIFQLLNDEIKINYWIFLRDIFRNLGYLTDRRHTEEYAFDIALGWLSEELIIAEIKNHAKLTMPKNYKFEAGFMGIDAEREYQKLNIRAKADFYVVKDQREKEELYEVYSQNMGKNAIYREKETKEFQKWIEKNIYIKIDLFVDYKGTWQKNRYFDLKKGKISHFNKGDLDWVLAFDVLYQNLFLISKNEATGYDLAPNPAMGNVLTAKIPLTNPKKLNEIFDLL